MFEERVQFLQPESCGHVLQSLQKSAMQSGYVFPYIHIGLPNMEPNNIYLLYPSTSSSTVVTVCYEIKDFSPNVYTQKLIFPIQQLGHHQQWTQLKCCM